MTCNKFTYNWSTPDATIGKITTSVDTSLTLTSTGDKLAWVDFYNKSINQLDIISYFTKPSSDYMVEYGSSWIKFIANSSGSIDVSQNDSNFTVRSTTPVIKFTCNFNINKLNLLTIKYDGQKQSVSAGYTVDPYKNNVLTLGALLDVLYPVGSIYTSMNNISPSQIFGGTWETISGRFMYCTTQSESKQTGGSKKITVNQLPAHNHSFTGNEISGRVIVRPLSNGESLIVQDPNDAGALQVEESQHGAGKGAQFAGWGGTIKPSKDIAFRATPSGIISNAGSGADYLPPYITIFAWYRVA